jgi:6-phosphogluconate dehydrogenase
MKLRRNWGVLTDDDDVHRDSTICRALTSYDRTMRIAMIGLGKMGANMTERLLLGGHEVVAYDRSPEAVAASVAKGAIAADSLESMVVSLGAVGQRVVWIMVPAGAPTQSTVDSLAELLGAGDIVIDGGNSKYLETQVRAEQLAAKGIMMLDSGTSGGIWGLDNGYCLMIGGPSAAYQRCEPIFTTLAPPTGGLIHVDEAHGSGHFVKMVHNGIEYAMMQSYAEGFEIIEKSPFNVDQAALAEAWMHGSVVRSWLLELLADYLAKDPQLGDLKAYVDDSGEGRWTVDAAVQYGAPAYVIAASLFARFASRDDNAYGLRMLSAMRNSFGGHAVKKS